MINMKIFQRIKAKMTDKIARKAKVLFSNTIQVAFLLIPQFVASSIVIFLNPLSPQAVPWESLISQYGTGAVVSYPTN